MIILFKQSITCCFKAEKELLSFGVTGSRGRKGGGGGAKPTQTMKKSQLAKKGSFLIEDFLSMIR